MFSIIGHAEQPWDPAQTFQSQVEPKRDIR